VSLFFFVGLGRFTRNAHRQLPNRHLHVTLSTLPKAERPAAAPLFVIMARIKLFRCGPGFFPALTILRFLLILVCLTLLSSRAQAQGLTETLVSSNSTWRFFRGTNEASVPPTAWRTNTFDDATWETGEAPFYYFATNATFAGGTLLSDMRSNYTCIFMRQTFVVTNVAKYIGLTNRPWADDSFILWLNGVEVDRLRIGSPGVFMPYNSNAIGSFFLNTPRAINAFTNRLLLGTNVLAVQIFNVSSNDADFFANTELTAGVADTVPPIVQSVAPAPGTLNTNLVQITVVFNEAVTNVRTTDLRINGSPASSLISNTPSSYSFGFPLLPSGPVSVAWNPATTIRDLSANLFSPTNTWAYNHVIDAPRVISATPPFGATVTNQLAQITVVFNRPVTGVSAEDLIVNGDPATSVMGSNTTYVFTVVPPLVPTIEISWDGNQVILDGAGVRMETASNSWTYTYIDTTPPTVLSRTPVAGSTVGSLGQAEVLFSEPVLGLDAADLLINGVPALSAVGSGAGPYLFQFAPPSTGIVQLAWSPGHNIRDTAPSANPFAGGSWTVTLNPTLFTGDIIINEIAAANVVTNGGPGTLDIDEFNQPEDWIELFNRGSNSVRLLGWALTDSQNEPGLWTFPDVTLGAGQYLVVYASERNRKVIGGTNRLHTSFALNPNGEYLALFNAEYPRRAVSEFSPQFPEQRNDYSYGLVGSNTWRYFSVPTPGAGNGVSTIAEVVPVPKVNVARGYFQAPFTLVASCDLTNATLRYTTNGSEPLGASPVFPGFLTISNTTVFRIAAFSTGMLPSRSSTHSYLFIDQVVIQPTNPPGFPSNWGTNLPDVGATVFSPGSTVPGLVPADYEVDQDPLRTDPLNPATPIDPVKLQRLKDGLRELPVISIVMNVEDLFGVNGIYQRSADETGAPGKPNNTKPASVEMILPDGTTAFNTTCGVDLFGNASRNPVKNPKHGIKLKFRNDYGPTSLEYKLFEDSPVEEFDDVLLRADFNSSWRHWSDTAGQGLGAFQRTRATRTRDAWMKQTRRDMGGLASHNRFVHLYLNGLYWGTFDLSEDPSESFGKTALGGSGDDYDVIDQGVLKNGTITAYNAMKALPAPTTLAQYDAYHQYLPMPEFIDYMMLHFFMGHQDWATEAAGNKNWAAIRKRVSGPEGTFRFLPWDGECILLETNVNRTTLAAANYPAGLHGKLRTNLQYQVDFADRVQKHMVAPGGMLLPEPNLARWQRWQAIMDKAIVGESVRWGDYRRDVHNSSEGIYQLYTREAHWLPENTRMVTSYFPNRTAIVLAQLRAALLYPSNTAPVFNQHGGRVPAGFALTMTATNAIYFTTNGVDPRVYGSGTLSPAAVLYTGPVSVGQSMVVKARMLVGTNWSALNEASFVVGSLTPTLRITEIMYNPFGGDAFEFIELQNTGPLALNLGNYSFAGINFVFPFGFTLSAGQRIVLANNLSIEAFNLRYPGVAVAGLYGGSLANGGETITLLDGAGRTVLSVSYDDENGWATAADGPGPSLEIINPNGDPDDAANWRSSTGFGGTPGAPNSAPSTATVVFNEIMADNINAVVNAGTYPDWIELYNTTDSPIDLSNWSLTDDGNPRKFVFSGTSIPANGYIVVWADAVTNTTPGIHTGIGLGRNGDSVFLYDANTNLVDAISFGPQVPNLTVGRIGSGWTLNQSTPNAVNVAATLGSAASLSINEWLANSAPGFDDWLELYNASASPVSLQNLYLGTSNALFQIRSLSFIPAGGFVQLIADERPGADHLDFKLTAATGAIVLYDTTGAELQRVIYGAQAQGVSQGRLPNGTANIVAFPNSPSPAASNYALNYTGPVLSELLARNSSAFAGPFANYADYLELFNPTTNAFDLGGMGLSDDADEIKYVFAPGTVIASNAYLVIWCDSGRAARTSAPLNAGFSLNGSSGGAYLFNTNGQLVDRVDYGFQATDLPIGLNGGQWRLLSAATPGSNNATVATLGSATNLRINEWMADPGNGENDWFELHNSDTLPVSLSGLYLTDDLSLAGLSNTPIANLSFIGAGDWVKWVADNDPSDGRDHTGFDLDQDADNIRLYAADFSIIDSVSFGAQLEGVSQGRLPDSSANIVSFPTTPTPEAANYLPLGNIIINEVLTHTDPPLEDAIEIQNTGPNAISMANWWISNSQRELKKHRIAAGTTLNAGAFKVFYENQFNASGTGTGTNFTLNAARGDVVYLSEADGSGNLTGYRAMMGFGAAENGVSFGRFTTSTGVDFTALAQRSFGSDTPASLAEFRTGTGLSNGYAKVGPVVINEIMYHPVGGTNGVELANEEFVELHNITANPVPLFDPARATNGWSLGGGISFRFNSNVTVGAFGFVTVVAFDPATNAPALAAFRAKYGTNGSIVGPYSGRLDNLGESVELSKPDAPQLPPHPDAGLVPMILVDRVVYSATNPWPTAADGGGASLQRVVSSLYGNEVLNWMAEAPNPGATNGAGGILPPTISQQPQNQSVVQGQTANFSVTGQGTAPLLYQWQRAGTNLPGANSSTLAIMNAQPGDAGVYRVVISNAANYIVSQDATLTVFVPAFIAVPPQAQFAVAGTTVQFNVTAGGTAPFFYQWRKGGSDLLGQNASLLTLNNVQPASAGDYSVVVTNNYGSATSIVAALTIVVSPTITDDPTNTTVMENDPVTFYVAATGTAPLTYQWRKDGINIPGANGVSYAIAAAQASDEGAYSVVVTNAGGTATSAPASLTVSTVFVLLSPTVRGDGAFEFTLMGRSNRNYTVEYTTDFNGWTNVTNLTLPGPQATVIDPGATNAPSRFYRVRLNP
jgi:hypothetical protein